MPSHTFRSLRVHWTSDPTSLAPVAGLAVVEITPDGVPVAGRQPDSTAAALLTAAPGPYAAGQVVALAEGSPTTNRVAVVQTPWQNGFHGEYVVLERSVNELLEFAAAAGATALTIPALGESAGWQADRAAYVLLNTAFRYAAEQQGSLQDVTFVADGPAWEAAWSRVTRTMLGT
jgi:O-acetyl-ADP-ribose deacetylase (regulator of RNase III)